MLKESNKSRFDSYSVRNSVLIISHNNFRDCRVHSFSDNLLEITVYGGLGDKFQPDVLNPFVPIYGSLLYYIHLESERERRTLSSHTHSNLTLAKKTSVQPRSSNYNKFVDVYVQLLWENFFSRSLDSLLGVRNCLRKQIELLLSFLFL